MAADLIHVGFDSYLALDRVLAVALPGSAPMKRAKPIVPAAPGMFSTGTVRTMPDRCSTCCMARAV